MKTANILIHESQFPENVWRDLLTSLRTRKINHKFHYDSVRQTQKWLALHQIYSPTRKDADCRAIYKKSFEVAVEKIKAKRVHVIGLGCGGGQKDTRLLKLLKAAGKKIFYTPCDVSTAMVLTARQTALAVLAEKNCFPFVCDLATVDDLSEFMGEGRRVGDPNFLGTAIRHPSHEMARLITFFGMIPNFEPQVILSKLASLVRPKDFLLFSANLAPGKNYAVGVKKVLPQYDNAATRDWLMTFLLDLGIEKRDGELCFQSEDAKTSGLKRIVADFHFHRPRQIEIEGAAFTFKAGEVVRLFFSYRYTPALIRKQFAWQGLTVLNEWMTKSEEEGVFLCCRN